MYDKTLYNRFGDGVNVEADKGRGTVWLLVSSTEDDEHDLISLNYEEFIKLRQMLTEAFSEMGW